MPKPKQVDYDEIKRIETMKSDKEIEIENLRLEILNDKKLDPIK